MSFKDGQLTEYNSLLRAEKEQVAVLEEELQVGGAGGFIGGSGCGLSSRTAVRRCKRCCRRFAEQANASVVKGLVESNTGTRLYCSSYSSLCVFQSSFADRPPVCLLYRFMH